MALCLLLAACGSGESHKEAEADAHDHSDVIILTPDKAKAAGVTVGTVEPGDFNDVINTGGKILSASGDETTVAATAAGIVSLNRTFTEGAPVGRGTTVFTISTSKLPEGDITGRAAISLSSARANYERATTLLADKLITQKEYNDAKAAYETARLAYEAVGHGAAGRGIAVTTPAGGYVKECLVKEGDYVDVGQPMMTVTQNRNLYLRAEVPEHEYGRLGRIQSARFRTSYDDKVYDLSELDGRLLSYGRSSGETSSFIPVTFELANRGAIIPGSYVEVYLLTTPRHDVISVPKEALTEEQGVHFVYIRLDEDCYRKQEVTTGATDGLRVEITDGLKAGDKVVTAGAIHVKLASAAASIPGHTHNH